MPRSLAQGCSTARDARFQSPALQLPRNARGPGAFLGSTRRPCESALRLHPYGRTGNHTHAHAPVSSVMPRWVRTPEFAARESDRPSGKTPLIRHHFRTQEQRFPAGAVAHSIAHANARPPAHAAMSVVVAVSGRTAPCGLREGLLAAMACCSPVHRRPDTRRTCYTAESSAFRQRRVMRWPMA